MMENGWKIRCMDKEYSQISMEIGMKVDSKMTSNLVKEYLCGPMVKSMKESTEMIKSTAKGPLQRRMVLSMLVNTNTGSSMEEVS